MSIYDQLSLYITEQECKELSLAVSFAESNTNDENLKKIGIIITRHQAKATQRKHERQQEILDIALSEAEAEWRN